MTQQSHYWASSDTLFSCPWSFPASGSFSLSCLCTSDDQNTAASASASVLPVNIQGWSPLRPTGICPEETIIEEDTCPPTFIVAWSLRGSQSESLSGPSCPLVGKRTTFTEWPEGFRKPHLPKLASPLVPQKLPEHFFSSSSLMQPKRDNRDFSGGPVAETLGH